MALFELFPDTAMAGGRLHQNGRIVDAGAYFGFGRGCDAPDRGRPLEDPGYHAQAWKPHSVSAVPFDHCVLDSRFAANALATLVPSGASLDQLGAWLGAAARRQKRRVIYTPFLSAIPGVDRNSHIPAVARRAFVTAHGDLMPDALLWPPHAGLTLGRPFRSMGPGLNAAAPGEPEAPLSYEAGARSRSVGARHSRIAGCPRRGVHRDDQRLRSFSGRALRRRDPVRACTDSSALRMDRVPGRARQRRGTGAAR